MWTSFSVTEGKEKLVCVPWYSLFPPWKPRREVLCSVFWRERDGWCVSGYVTAQEASVTAKPHNEYICLFWWMNLWKFRLQRCSCFCCSEQQNHFPQRKSFELLLLKSVFKVNLFNTVFAWGLTKSADNHTGPDQWLPLSCFSKYTSLNPRVFDSISSQCAFSEI